MSTLVIFTVLSSTNSSVNVKLKRFESKREIFDF